MEILEIAIQAEGGIGKLSKKLGLKHPSQVSNWKSRGLPEAWRRLLVIKYGKRKHNAAAT